MKLFPTSLAFLAAIALVFSFGYAAETVKSGPQVGEKVPGPFHPLNINGENAGKTHCLYCENGNNPVAMIFAREVSPSLSTLIKKIDAITEANKSAKMGSFVVFLNNSAGLEKELKDMATKAELKKCVLSVDDNTAGPKGYNVAKDADVTVVLYVERTVKANYSFKKGELKDNDIEKILSDVAKIVK